MAKLISNKEHIEHRCAEIARLLQQLVFDDLTKEQRDEIAHNIKVHQKIAKQLEKEL